MDIIGDGPAKAEVTDLLNNFCDHITFRGELGKLEIADFYNKSAVFLWPGVDEAFGMVYLEAQAAGLPIVAQNRPGVRDVITTEAPLCTIDDTARMAASIDQLFQSDTYWKAQSIAGRNFIAENHLIGSTAKILWTALNPLLGLDA